jgi:ATP-binding cassette subfamily A (ABC1) protein 3
MKVCLGRGVRVCNKKIVLQNYGSLLAVADVSLRVRAGECFGLLGVNGAGKTSTFQMLTGDSRIDGGQVTLDPNVGYCPQFDAIVGKFTGDELVRLMARIRGVPPGQVDGVAKRVLKAVGITKSTAAHPARTYSGGTRRRLSLALALAGGARVLLLDEPTTGVDPAARRALWTVLTAMKDAGTAVLLTSHSMEECDALCSQLAIMVAGRFECYGSPQHLKTRWSQGYAMVLKLQTVDAIPSVQQRVQREFAGAATLKVRVENWACPPRAHRKRTSAHSCTQSLNRTRHARRGRHYSPPWSR